MPASTPDRWALGLTIVAFALIVSYFSPVGCNGIAQEGLPTAKMQIGNRQFELEIASTDKARQRGLMYRPAMAEDHGMIFVFQQEEPLSFWMKNTLIPLDIIYMDSGGTVVSVKQMQPHDESGVPSEKPARYAIELNQGMAAKAGVKKGDRLVLPTEAVKASKN
jgi:uncharacterized membrane protein (UPF0127 family)